MAARNLPKRDVVSKSDPFAIASMCAKPSDVPYNHMLDNHNEFRTATIANDHNPTWNKTCKFKSNGGAPNERNE